ncbi:MAG: YfhO family protein [Oscillospiraceae bacterium]|nr:YfhO family protein [Oscillospiraceae bacterium]
MLIYLQVAGENTYMYCAASDVYLLTVPQMRELREFYLDFLHDNFAVMDYNTLFGSEQLFSVGLVFNPFNLIILLFPESYLVYYVKVLFTVCMYMAGVGFIVMCKNMNVKPWAAAAASLLYVFSPFTFTKALVYTIFTSAIATFPFMITGIERILQKKSSSFFVWSCVVAALTGGLYMFAYQVILTVIYAFVKVIFMGDAKGFLGRLWSYGWRGGLAALTGVALCAAAIFPQMASIFASSRTSGAREYIIEEAFSANYTDLSLIFAGSKEDQSLGTALAPLVIIFIIIKGAPAAYKLLMGLCALGIYYPVFSAALCTFSYIEHRWAFAIMLLGAYGAAYVIENFHKTDISDRVLAGAGLIIYAFCSDYMTAFAAVPALIIYLLLVNIPPLRRGIDRLITAFDQKRKYISDIMLFLLLIMFSIVLIVINNEYYTYLTIIILLVSSVISLLENRALKVKYLFTIVPVLILPFVIRYTYYRILSMDDAPPSEMRRIAVLEEIRDKDMAEGDEIVRFESCNVNEHYNIGFSNNLASTSVFVNMFSGRFSRMLEEAEFDLWCHGTISSMTDFGQRLPFMAVMGVDYIHTEKTLSEAEESPEDKSSGSKFVPFTFEHYMEYEADGILNNVYKNKFSLPFGFTYDKVGSQKEREGLNGADYSINMMYSAGLDDEYITGETVQPVSFEVPYSMTSEVVRYDEGRDIAYTLYTIIPDEPISNGEVYITVSGIDVDSNLFGGIVAEVNGNGQQIIGDFGGSFYTENYNWATSQDSYTITCSTFEEEIKRIEINLSCEFDSIRLTMLPLNDYIQQFEELSEYTLQNTVLGADEITGNIAVPDERILCLQLQFDKGWKAYDNGEPIEIIPVNGFMTGLRLSPGEHEIRLVYRVPWLMPGIGVSAVTVVILLGVWAVGRKKKLSAVDGISENPDISDAEIVLEVLENESISENSEKVNTARGDGADLSDNDKN